MKAWSEIRRQVFVEGLSWRQILREPKMHWLTLKKILEHRESSDYRQRQTRPRKKLGAHLERIRQILASDRKSLVCCSLQGPRTLAATRTLR
jgi:hypothetical protein